MFITKYRKQYRDWATAKINILATAKKMGYSGAALIKGVRKVRKIMSDMGIAVPVIRLNTRKNLRTVV